jgi:hypothetical protein
MICHFSFILAMPFFPVTASRFISAPQADDFKASRPIVFIFVLYS